MCPVAYDYWQPGANATNYLWTNPFNWSGGVPTTSSQAVFDSTHAGANCNCEVPSSAEVYSFEIWHAWEKTVYLDAGVVMTCDYYMNLNGSTNAQVYMTDTASKMQILAKDYTKTSTWNAGSFTGARETLQMGNGDNAATNSVIFNIATPGYTNSDIILDPKNITSGKGVYASLNQAGGSMTLGKDNNAKFTIDSGDFLIFNHTGFLIKNTVGNNNSYINNINGSVFSSSVSPVEEDVPILNKSIFSISGTFTMDGSQSASDVALSGTSYHFLNSGASASAFVSDAAINAVAADWVFTVGGACKGYAQTGGLLEAGDLGTGQQVMELNGASDNTGLFTFTGGSVQVGDKATTTVLILKSGHQGAQLNATGTKFFFTVAVNETSNNYISTTNIATTVDNTDKAYISGGANGPNNPQKTFTFLKNGAGSTETGLWGWDFTGTNDKNNWVGCVAGGGDLTAKH